VLVASTTEHGVESKRTITEPKTLAQLAQQPLALAPVVTARPLAHRAEPVEPRHPPVDSARQLPSLLQVAVFAAAAAAAGAAALQGGEADRQVGEARRRRALAGAGAAGGRSDRLPGIQPVQLREESQEQGLTLVRFSAQLEPRLTQEYTLHTP